MIDLLQPIPEVTTPSTSPPAIHMERHKLDATTPMLRPNRSFRSHFGAADEVNTFMNAPCYRLAGRIIIIYLPFVTSFSRRCSVHSVLSRVPSSRLLDRLMGRRSDCLGLRSTVDALALGRSNQDWKDELSYFRPRRR